MKRTDYDRERNNWSVMMEIIHAGKTTLMTVPPLCSSRHSTATCEKQGPGKVLDIIFTPNESYCINM